jgi:hypothetical protein
MASSTASNTCAAANLAAVAAHPPVPVMDRTGTAITGTTANAHAVSTSARLYRSASSSSLLQTTPLAAGPAREVTLTPEHQPRALIPGSTPTRLAIMRPGRYTAEVSTPLTIRHSLHPRRPSNPPVRHRNPCSVSAKWVFGISRNGRPISPKCTLCAKCGTRGEGDLVAGRLEGVRERHERMKVSRKRQGREQSAHMPYFLVSPAGTPPRRRQSASRLSFVSQEHCGRGRHPFTTHTAYVPTHSRSSDTAPSDRALRCECVWVGGWPRRAMARRRL